MIKFFVAGVPVPKGSAKAFMNKGMKHPVVIQDNAEQQKPWASLIGYSAQWALVECIHGSKPDLDKLIRCVKDALTGIAWKDDSQVSIVHARKIYSARAGASIEISELELQ